MPSRLPIAVPPAHHETVVSYLSRLATLHAMPFAELWPQVSQPRHVGSTSRRVAGDQLAAVTGLPEALLGRALVELRQPEPDWLAFRHEPQRGCPGCTARHPGLAAVRALAGGAVDRLPSGRPTPSARRLTEPVAVARTSRPRQGAGLVRGGRRGLFDRGSCQRRVRSQRTCRSQAGQGYEGYHNHISYYYRPS